MTLHEQEKYMLSNRDEAEKNRLNFQHELITKLNDGLVLDLHIPKDGIINIADVATGSGIWLESVAKELSGAGNNISNLVGFDISDTQFPIITHPKIIFVLADMTKGFPEEYHGLFDVVHIRLAALALTTNQIRPTVKNVVQLLKPGGYLQWDDADLHQLPNSLFPTNRSLSCEPEGILVKDFIVSQGFSLDIFSEIRGALESHPVETIHTRVYETARRPELQEILLEWHRQTAIALLVPVWLRSGKAKSKEQTKELTEDYLGKVEEMAKIGVVFGLPLVRMVAQKRLEG